MSGSTRKIMNLQLLLVKLPKFAWFKDMGIKNIPD